MRACAASAGCASRTATRAPSLPEVPTYQEAGFAVVLDQWLGFLLPAKAPAEAVAPQGLEPVGGSVEEFAKLYRGDYEKYARLVKELNISLN